MINPFSKYGRIAKPAPQGAGKAFFVAASGSTLTPSLLDQFKQDEDGVLRVFSTIAEALTNCVAGRGDFIYVLPGTYTITTALAMSKSEVHLIALGSPGTVILTGSGADIMDVTAAGCEIAGFQLNLASTKIAIDLSAADGVSIHDNVFLSAVGGAASHFIRMAGTATNYGRIFSNRFVSNLVVAGGAITQTSHITGLGIGNIIEQNVFVAGRVTTANAGAVTDAVVFNAAADCGNIVRQNTFVEVNGATFTAGVESGASAVSGSVLPIMNNFLLGTAANAIVNTTGSAGFGNNMANGTV